MKPLTELLDDLPQIVRVLLNDSPHLLQSRWLGLRCLLTWTWLVRLVHAPMVRRAPKWSIDLNQKAFES
jgi:hypothetical protein